jgi:hypothetical protein
VKRLSAAAAFLLILACRSGNAACSPCTVVVPNEVEGATAHPGLRDAARRALEALALCNPYDPAIASAGFADPDQSRQFPATAAARCLRVTSWSRETDALVSFDLVPPGQRIEDGFVMLAVWDGGRWKFTWPAGIGMREVR